MSRAAPTPNPTDLTDLQLAQLARLAEIGMEIAEVAGRQARGLAEGEGAGADPALSFARVARAVRLTIALQVRLAADKATAERGERAVRASKAARRRDQIRAKVEQLVERVAETEGAEADAVERLSSAAWERLTETEDEDVLDLPIAEVVAQICADLGLSLGWAAGAFGPAPASDAEGPLSQASPDSSPGSRGSRALIESPAEQRGWPPNADGAGASPSDPPRRMSG